MSYSLNSFTAALPIPHFTRQPYQQLFQLPNQVLVAEHRSREYNGIRTAIKIDRMNTHTPTNLPQT